jgi:hypothetical protein
MENRRQHAADRSVAWIAAGQGDLQAMSIDEKEFLSSLLQRAHS